MSYDFVNNLEISENVLSLSELENQKSFEETPDEPVIKPAEDPVNPDAVFTVNLNEEPEITSSTSSKPDTKGKSVFQTFVEEFLTEEGLDISELDLPEIKSAKEAKEIIAQLYSSERDEQIETYKNQFLTPLQKKFADLVEKGVTPEDAGTLMISHKNIEGITEDSIYEDKTKAKALYQEYLKKTTKFSEAKIQKEIEMKDELGTLEDDAKEVLSELKSILKSEEDALVQTQKEKEIYEIQSQKAKIQQLQEYLDTTENIGGFSLTKPLKEKWKKEYSLIEVETPEGKMKVQPVQAARLNNPSEFDALMRLYNTLGLFKYDARKKSFSPDFSALKALGAKETISEFEKAVASSSERARQKGGAAIQYDDDSKQNEIDKWKELIGKVKPKH
jgi:hypothetical protein